MSWVWSLYADEMRQTGFTAFKWSSQPGLRLTSAGHIKEFSIIQACHVQMIGPLPEHIWGENRGIHNCINTALKW